MIRQALVAMGPRTLLPLTLVGGAALGLGAYFWPHAAATPSVYRLVLHAPEVPAGTFYVSAWNDGAVLASHDASDHQPVVYTRRGQEHDGCTWQGIERLTPIGPHAYRYSYQENILACQPNANPFVKTPRVGIVTTEKLTAGAPLTPYDAMQAPGNLWNTAVSRCGCQMQMQLADVDDDLDDADEDLDEAMKATSLAIDEAMAEAAHALRDAQDLAAHAAEDDE